MSHTAEAFKNGKALIAFLTAGDPSIEDSVRYVKVMEEAGADLIEIGVPFSDPIADGPVIMEADVRALAHHIHLPQAMEEARAIRKVSRIPLVFLTYFNPVFSYGVEKFFSDCEKIGVDGVIIPDLPYEEQGEVRPFADAHHVDVIQLVAPTSGDRIEKTLKDATGFVYLVSSMGVTGMRSDFKNDIEKRVEAIRKVTDIPVAVGFGIHTPEQAREMAEAADGVITGSGVVDIIGKHGESADKALAAYIGSLKKAIR